MSSISEDILSYLLRGTFRDDRSYFLLAGYLFEKYTDAYPYKLLWIDPAEVELVTIADDNVDRTTSDWHPLFPHNTENRGLFWNDSVGEVRGGAWDSGTLKFTDLPEYRSLSRWYAEGQEIESTEFYRRCVNYLEAGHEWGGYGSPESFKQAYLADVQRLFESIETHGYRSQRELCDHDGGTLPRDETGRLVPLMEVRVNIGRNGEFLFNHTQGHHRLAAAKLLEVPEIPVCVIARHRNWQERRENVLSGSQKEDHPDLRGLTNTSTLQRRLYSGLAKIRR